MVAQPFYRVQHRDLQLIEPGIKPVFNHLHGLVVFSLIAPPGSTLPRYVYKYGGQPPGYNSKCTFFINQPQATF